MSDPVSAHLVGELVHAEVIDVAEIEELLAFIQTNKKNLTKTLLISQINKIGVTKQLEALKITSDDQGNVTNNVRLAAAQLSITSPSQASSTNKVLFRVAATGLVGHFLPLEPNPTSLIETLRLNSPAVEARKAWTKVLHAVAESFNHLINNQFRPAVQRLIEAIKAGDTTEKLNSHMVLLNQNIELLEKAVQNVDADFEN